MDGRICYSLNSEGLLTWVSKNVFELTGWMPEEAVGKYFDFFLPEFDLPMILQNRLNRKAGITHEYNTTILKKDGGRTPVRIRVLQTPENTVGSIDRRAIDVEGKWGRRIGDKR